MMRSKWGHPAWHPDSRHIVEIGYELIDSENGKTERLQGLPPMGSGHPSSSPNGKLLVTDLVSDPKTGEWSVVIADARGNDSVVLDQFNNSHGARSWRVSHPHPVFSGDGHRIYFNVSSGPWTELYVAESGLAQAKS
jgi:Tol biopolymer transport system component